MSNVKGWTTCPVCRARLKADKLDGHIRNVHPKGAKTSEERTKIKARRRTASNAARWAALVAVIVVILIVAIYIYTVIDLTPRGTSVGQKPYDFSLLDQNNDKYSINDNLGQRPIVLGFMSTKCTHCSNEANVYKQLYDNFSADTEFIIVITNYDATRTEMKGWVIDHDLEFTVVFDADGKTFSQYGIDHWPVTFLVKKDGKISWTNKNDLQHGFYTYGELSPMVEKLK